MAASFDVTSADLRVVEIADLDADESTLTGESGDRFFSTSTSLPTA
jgi:hypothetical protein